MNKNTIKGQAAILIVFILSMASILVGISLIQTGFWESLMGRTAAASSRAFYAANSGVEEAFWKVQHIDSYGYPGPDTFEVSLGDAGAKVKIYGSEDLRTIEVTGIYGPYVRRLKVDIQNTSLKPGFGRAVHAGLGGVELRNNTEITGKEDADGNVFSNSFIKGAKNDYVLATGECKNSSSKVDGSAWAVENIDKIAENDSGICIVKDAHAASLDYCFVNGVPYAPEAPSPSCPSTGVWANEPAPTPVPLPDMGIDNFKNYLSSRGEVFSGDCILDGSGQADDCSGGTNTIGNLIVTGSLIKPSNRNIKVSGPVWVKGNVLLNSLGSVKLVPEITDISQMIVADGQIISDSNVSFGSNQDAFLLLISTFAPETLELCEDASVTLSSNTESVLFYATDGCIEVTANSTFHGAILGERILIANNSSVEYDPALASAIFGLTKSGGWQILSFKEE